MPESTKKERWKFSHRNGDYYVWELEDPEGSPWDRWAAPVSSIVRKREHDG